MGPITLFDKSFIQSLTLDESVWFDNFFIANVCPLFFVETLADLHKATSGRSPEDEVRIIADKFPERSGQLNALHQAICVAELFGEKVSMRGQILPPHEKFVPTSQGMAVTYDETDEAKAFKRWADREFTELEHEYARKWRKSYPLLDKDSSREFIEKSGARVPSAQSLVELKQFADEIVDGKHTTLDPFQFVFSLLNIPDVLHDRIISKWQAAGCPKLADYSPYTAYVISLQFFFHAAVAKSQISVRPSNSVDIAYLFYLPFCQMFVSSDSLHRRVAPLLIRSDQLFVWGLDLKSDLAKLDAHYRELPEEIKEQGLYSFASEPPRDGEFLVSKLWDQFLPAWRSAKVRTDPLSDDIKNLLEEVKQKQKTAAARDIGPNAAGEKIRVVTVVRRVHKKRGSWFQVPKDMPADEP